ncbi:MAG: hypothetical protein KGZ85_02620 [Ignavibacterium sp.]|nr:hypothetical protein [Ignavibacterium sp.]
MTTPKSQFKKYIYVFGTILLLSLLFIFAAAIYFQPLEGELTRLGSYSERDFGWNLPQKKVRGDANMAKDYQGYYDVLIVGDSFSTNGVWQPFFRKETGLSYVTLDVRKTHIYDLLDSQSFRNHPPKVFIVQSVEREIVYFFSNLSFPCINNDNNNVKINLSFRPPGTSTEYYEEIRKTFDIRNINLRYTASVMFNAVIRKLHGRDLKYTQKYNLLSHSLFSNTKSNEILVYAGDIDKLNWKREGLTKSICAIRGLQNLVQKHGKTLFIFMLAPDKSTAYADYIAEPVFQTRLNIQQQFIDSGVNAPRIDLKLNQAIESGIKDIYLPSGTHWSATGYEIAAKCIVDFIKQHSIEDEKSH